MFVRRGPGVWFYRVIFVTSIRFHFLRVTARLFVGSDDVRALFIATYRSTLTSSSFNTRLHNRNALHFLPVDRFTTETLFNVEPSQARRSHSSFCRNLYRDKHTASVAEYHSESLHTLFTTTSVERSNKSSLPTLGSATVSLAYNNDYAYNEKSVRCKRYSY